MKTVLFGKEVCSRCSGSSRNLMVAFNAELDEVGSATFDTLLDLLDGPASH